MTLVHPPKMVFDDRGSLVEVILSAEDFRTYLRAAVADTPWDEMSPAWQDVLDRLLIEDVAPERDGAIDLETILADEAT